MLVNIPYMEHMGYSVCIYIYMQYIYIYNMKVFSPRKIGTATTSRQNNDVDLIMRISLRN